MAMVVHGAGGSAAVDEERLRQNFDHLCIRGNVAQIQELLEALPEQAVAVASAGKIDIKQNPEGRSGLHFAALGGHLRLAQMLLQRKCPPDSRDVNQLTPLHIACMEDHAEIALELLVAKADADALDVNQQSALHKAMLLRTPTVLSVLLNHGHANLALCDSTNSSAISIAAGHGSVEHLACLLERDPSLALTANESGWTPLHLAAHGREMRRNSMSKPAKFGTVVKLLLEARAAVDATDDVTKTALHRAAHTGNAETAAELVKGGADVMAGDITRWTPLHYACQDGHLAVATLLLNARAAVQRESPVCLTPLALATMENQIKIAELLVKHGADPHLRAKGLASAFMIARKDPNQYDDILALFELGFVNHHEE